MKKDAVRYETIGDVCSQLLGEDWADFDELASWPPYLFAIAALLLKRTGGYTRVLRNWQAGTSRSWNERAKDYAKQWRKACTAAPVGGVVKLPDPVARRWKAIVSAAGMELRLLERDERLLGRIIELLGICDEACIGIGLPSPSSGARDEFLSRGRLRLHRHHTLTPGIPASTLTVLPKQHTPRNGLTLRSMSHHLALHMGADSRAKWRALSHPYGSRLNVVLAPWPLVVKPRQFQEAQCDGVALAPKYGCFDYVPERAATALLRWTQELLAGAKDLCGRVDVVVFPEAALTPEQFEKVSALIDERAEGALLVAGVLEPGETGLPAKNRVWIRAAGHLGVTIRQGKHHRWRLDAGQVQMYGLGGALATDHDWWEHIEVGSREINFMAMDGDMTLCCLVCEDLARQDPVVELVRAVGPNLVIALLADAPQLSTRWPNRYATVLADDPGCSVLTMTSLGMAQLAKPPAGKPRSRSIALWKDALRGEAEQIELQDGALGVVLNLRTHNRTEWTADGRTDDGVAAYPQLVGVHCVK